MLLPHRPLLRYDCSGFPGLAISVFSSAARAAVGGDEWLAELLPDGRVRVAVLDGTTAFADAPPAPAGQDRAVWAAGVLRTGLRAEAPLAECCAWVNTLLCEPELSPSRHRPSAAVAAVDLAPRATGDPEQLAGTAVTASDCALYLPGPTCWVPALAGDHLTAPARSHWNHVRDRHLRRCRTCVPGRWCVHLERLEAETLDAPGCRTSPAVGRDRDLCLRSLELPGPAAFLLTSDGVPAEVFASTAAWAVPTTLPGAAGIDLGALEAALTAYCDHVAHRDVTVLVARALP